MTKDELDAIRERIADSYDAGADLYFALQDAGSLLAEVERLRVEADTLRRQLSGTDPLHAAMLGLT